MSRRTRLSLAGFSAAAVLAVAAGSAPARHMHISARNTRTIWQGWAFSNTVNQEIVRCPVTLEGSFPSATISKTVGVTIGRVSRASVASASCTSGHATVHSETLPWTISYEAFFGRLPNIAHIELLLLGVSFEIESGGTICSATSEAAHPVRSMVNLNEATGEITGLELEGNARIPLTNGFCALAEGAVSGTGTVTQQGTTLRVTVELI